MSVRAAREPAQCLCQKRAMLLVLVVCPHPFRRSFDDTCDDFRAAAVISRFTCAASSTLRSSQWHSCMQLPALRRLQVVSSLSRVRVVADHMTGFAPVAATLYTPFERSPTRGKGHHPCQTHTSLKSPTRPPASSSVRTAEKVTASTPRRAISARRQNFLRLRVMERPRWPSSGVVRSRKRGLHSPVGVCSWRLSTAGPGSINCSHSTPQARCSPCYYFRHTTLLHSLTSEVIGPTVFLAGSLLASRPFPRCTTLKGSNS